MLPTTTSALTISAILLATATSAAGMVVDGCSIPTATEFATAKSTSSGFHASDAARWPVLAGVGSHYSLSSHNWTVGSSDRVARTSFGPLNLHVDVTTYGAVLSSILPNHTMVHSGASGRASIASSTAHSNHQDAFTKTLVSIVGADNAALLAFRFVGVSPVAEDGTSRIDDNIVAVNVIPAQGAITLLGLAGLAARRRR